MQAAPEIIIADASCIIILYETRLLELLEKLYFTVTITSPVAKEIKITPPSWMKIADPSDSKLFSKLLAELDAGEASSIALAAEHENSLLIIDEKDGRKIAAELQIQIIGTLAVLFEAKQRGILPSFKAAVFKLTEKGFRASPQLIQKFLNQSGEN